MVRLRDSRVVICITVRLGIWMPSSVKALQGVLLWGCALADKIDPVHDRNAVDSILSIILRAGYGSRLHVGGDHDDLYRIDIALLAFLLSQASYMSSHDSR